MKTVTIAGLLALLMGSPAFAEDSEAVKKDLGQLQGEWSMVSGVANGQSMPEDMRKQMKRVCKRDIATTTMNGEIYLKAKISIDPSKNPKTIDYDMVEGFTKGKKQLGIYEIEGDKFKACFAKPGGERPTEFSSKSGDEQTLSVWKREEAAEEPKSKR